MVNAAKSWPGPTAILRWAASASVRVRGADLEVWCGRSLVVHLDDERRADALCASLANGAPWGVAAAIAGERGRLVLERMEACGAIDVAPARVLRADLASEPLRCDALDDLADAGLLVVTGDAEAQQLAAWQAEARERRVHALFVWFMPGAAALAYDDGHSTPCVRCAWLFDTRFELLTRALSWRASGEPSITRRDEPMRRVVEAVLENAIGSVRSLPPPGTSLVFESGALEVRRARFRKHPSCGCHEDTAPRRPVGASASARFAPVFEAASSRDEVRRTGFRRSRSPWPLDAMAFGRATAAGADAKLRARAEGIERFAMLHAPPNVFATPAGRLEHEVLDAAEIAMSTFRDEERAAPGFRFPRYSNDLAIDWSWATAARGTSRVLVPTSLVGRPSEHSHRLVDATSSGYAAHRDRTEARVKALLELVERDAVLLAWYTNLAEPISVDEVPSHAGLVELRAFSVTHDIDVPVVLLLARMEDGSLRCASSAGVAFDEAWRGAQAELKAALATYRHAHPRARRNLADVCLRLGPEDHLAHYTDRTATEAALAGFGAATGKPIQAYRARWPERAGTRIDAVVSAVENTGAHAWFVDRSLPSLFPRWSIVRAFVPGLVELSWGQGYRRLASPRIARRLRAGAPLTPWPHPLA